MNFQTITLKHLVCLYYSTCCLQHTLQCILAHMVSNEAFLDSAVRRNSVVSIAKTMGYTPRSARSAKSAINLTVVPSSSYVSTSLTLTKDKQFQSSVNGVTRNFVPDKDYVISKTVEDGVAAFRFTDVRLIEGTRTTTSEIITTQNRSGAYRFGE